MHRVLPVLWRSIRRWPKGMATHGPSMTSLACGEAFYGPEDDSKVIGLPDHIERSAAAATGCGET